MATVNDYTNLPADLVEIAQIITGTYKKAWIVNNLQNAL